MPLAAVGAAVGLATATAVGGGGEVGGKRRDTPLAEGAAADEVEELALTGGREGAED